MTAHVLTDWNVGVRSDRELFYNTLRRNTSLLEVTPHLSRSCLMRSVRGSNLDGMVFCLIRFDCFNVCCDLAILQL